MVSKNCSIIGEHVIIIFVTQYNNFVGTAQSQVAPNPTYCIILVFFW